MIALPSSATFFTEAVAAAAAIFLNVKIVLFLIDSARQLFPSPILSFPPSDEVSGRRELCYKVVLDQQRSVLVRRMSYNGFTPTKHPRGWLMSTTQTSQWCEHDGLNVCQKTMQEHTVCGSCRVCLAHRAAWQLTNSSPWDTLGEKKHDLPSLKAPSKTLVTNTDKRISDGTVTSSVLGKLFSGPVESCAARVETTGLIIS